MKFGCLCSVLMAEVVGVSICLCLAVADWRVQP